MKLVVIKDFKTYKTKLKCLYSNTEYVAKYNRKKIYKLLSDFNLLLQWFNYYNFFFDSKKKCKFSLLIVLINLLV